MVTQAKEIKQIKILKTSWVGRCKKCNGRLYISHDQHGNFASCLYCGWEQGALVLETKNDFDMIAKYLNGNYGASLPSDKDLKFKDEDDE